MSTPRTRKQTRQSLTPDSRTVSTGSAANGSAKSPRSKRKSASPVPASGAQGAGYDGDDNDGYPKENIFLFWPNIIGYARIVLAVGSLYYMPLHPRTCALLYSVSCLLDALDGFAARYFDQSTKFGAVLDMITDRCTTACLLVFLASAWPRWSIVFQGLIALDFASHWLQMVATLTMGNQGQSHKAVDSSRSKIMHLYYTNKNVLFVCCLFNELFFIGLYLLSFSSPTLSPSLLQPASSAAAPQSAQPGSPALPKLSSLFPNPYSAGALELARANKMDSFLPWVITGVSTPLWAFKQFVNVVQLVKASKWLAEGDIAARRAEGLPRKKLR